MLKPKQKIKFDEENDPILPSDTCYLVSLNKNTDGIIEVYVLCVLSVTLSKGNGGIKWKYTRTQHSHTLWEWTKLASLPAATNLTSFFFLSFLRERTFPCEIRSALHLNRTSCNLFGNFFGGEVRKLKLLHVRIHTSLLPKETWISGGNEAALRLLCCVETLLMKPNVS